MRLGPPRNPHENRMVFPLTFRLFVELPVEPVCDELERDKKEDKDGNILDEPVKFNDHLMDALRYALVSHFRLMGGTTSFYIG